MVGRVAEAAVDSGLGGGAAHRFRVGTGGVAAGLVLYLIAADVWWLVT
jgi:hypothetical protein